jgi:hypothetical protein
LDNWHFAKSIFFKKFFVFHWGNAAYMAAALSACIAFESWSFRLDWDEHFGV